MQQLLQIIIKTELRVALLRVNRNNNNNHATTRTQRYRAVPRLSANPAAMYVQEVPCAAMLHTESKSAERNILTTERCPKIDDTTLYLNITISFILILNLNDLYILEQMVKV